MFLQLTHEKNLFLFFNEFSLYNFIINKLWKGTARIYYRKKAGYMFTVKAISDKDLKTNNV